MGVPSSYIAMAYSLDCVNGQFNWGPISRNYIVSTKGEMQVSEPDIQPRISAPEADMLPTVAVLCGQAKLPLGTLNKWCQALLKVIGTCD